MRNIPNKVDSDSSPDDKPIKIRKKSNYVSLYQKADYGNENVWPADLGNNEVSKKRPLDDFSTKVATRKVVKRLSNASQTPYNAEDAAESKSADAFIRNGKIETKDSQLNDGYYDNGAAGTYGNYEHYDDTNQNYDYTCAFESDAKETDTKNLNDNDYNVFSDSKGTTRPKESKIDYDDCEGISAMKPSNSEPKSSDIRGTTHTETDSSYSYVYSPCKGKCTSTKSNPQPQHYDEKDAELEEDRWERVNAVFSRVRHDRRDAVKEALDEGFDPYSVDENGNTMLHVCAQNNLKKMAAELLRRGCFLNALNKKKLTPLDYCDSLKYDALGEWLISKGAERGPRSQFVDPLRC
jgi:hypothetical protein